VVFQATSTTGYVVDNFDVSFKVLMGGGLGTGGDGLSFCYGDLPDVEKFATSKETSGLCVILSTSEGHITSMYNGIILSTHTVDVDVLRTGEAWGDVRILHDGSSLTVEYNKVVYMEAVEVSEWSVMPRWRFGIAARTGTTQKDNHWVDDVSIKSGAYHESMNVPLEISSNGQQFSTSKVSFEYTLPSVVSSFFPERGPLSGGSMVTLLGFGLGGGADYRCRFGSMVTHASYDMDAGVMRCISTHQEDEGAYELEVSLNAQDYIGSPMSFTYYDLPVVSMISPERGGVSGETLVRVFGSRLEHGMVYTCKFGVEVVDATLDTGDNTVLCYSPTSAQASLVWRW
jgi:hypothetical protein